MGEQLKPGEVWKSARRKRVEADLGRRAVNNEIFESMMLAADEGEFSWEDAIKSLSEKPTDGIS